MTLANKLAFSGHYIQDIRAPLGGKYLQKVVFFKKKNLLCCIDDNHSEILFMHTQHAINKICFIIPSESHSS